MQFESLKLCYLYTALSNWAVYRHVVKKDITVNPNEMYCPFLVECQNTQGPKKH